MTMWTSEQALATHLDPTVQQAGRQVLAEMRELGTSLTYASFLTDDGFEVVRTDRPSVDGGRFASMSSSVQALGEAIARELTIGESEYVIIATERGHVIQLRTPGQPIVLAALFDTNETLGKALSTARLSANRMAELLADRA